MPENLQDYVRIHPLKLDSTPVPADCTRNCHILVLTKWICCLSTYIMYISPHIYQCYITHLTICILAYFSSCFCRFRIIIIIIFFFANSLDSDHARHMKCWSSNENSGRCADSLTSVRAFVAVLNKRMSMKTQTIFLSLTSLDTSVYVISTKSRWFEMVLKAINKTVFKDVILHLLYRFQKVIILTA